MWALTRRDAEGRLICTDVSPESPEGRYHPSLVATAKEVPDDTQNGWIYDEATGKTYPPPQPKEGE